MIFTFNRIKCNHCFFLPDAHQLLEDRLDSHIRIEEYIQGRSLTLTYWRELSQHDPSSQLGYRLTVQTDPTQPSKPLTVLHTPCLGSKVRYCYRSVASHCISWYCWSYK